MGKESQFLGEDAMGAILQFGTLKESQLFIGSLVFQLPHKKLAEDFGMQKSEVKTTVRNIFSSVSDTLADKGYFDDLDDRNARGLIRKRIMEVLYEFYVEDIHNSFSDLVDRLNRTISTYYGKTCRDFVEDYVSIHSPEYKLISDTPLSQRLSSGVPDIPDLKKVSDGAESGVIMDGAAFPLNSKTGGIFEKIAAERRAWQAAEYMVKRIKSFLTELEDDIKITKDIASDDAPDSIKGTARHRLEIIRQRAINGTSKLSKEDLIREVVNLCATTFVDESLYLNVTGVIEARELPDTDVCGLRSGLEGTNALYCREFVGLFADNISGILAKKFKELTGRERGSVVLQGNSAPVVLTVARGIVSCERLAEHNQCPEASCQ